MLRQEPAEKKKTNLLNSSLVSAVSSVVKDKPKIIIKFTSDQHSQELIGEGAISVSFQISETPKYHLNTGQVSYSNGRTCPLIEWSGFPIVV